jgi:hypothetical protein
VVEDITLVVDYLMPPPEERAMTEHGAAPPLTFLGWCRGFGRSCGE